MNQQEWVQRHFSALEQQIKTKYRLIAQIKNKPIGLISNAEYRKEVEERCYQNIREAIRVLESSCNVISLYFGSYIERFSMKDPIIHSERLKSLGTRLYDGGLSNEMRTYRFATVDEHTPNLKKAMTEYIHTLVRDNGIYLNAFNVRTYKLEKNALERVPVGYRSSWPTKLCN